MPTSETQPISKTQCMSSQQRLSAVMRGLLRPKWSIQKQARSSEQGLTLLECLIAVAVMGLTVGLVLPPLLIASATRVQTRRAEQALQLAQGEVDRVRIIVARGDHTPANLPANIGNTTNLEAFPAPGGALNQLKSSVNCGNNYNGTQIAANQALRVDVNGDCQPDFLMQVFRTRGSTTRSESGNQDRPSEFRLGVRVYSITSIRGENFAGLGTEQASLSLTNSERNQLNQPLAVLYTQVSWGDRDSTLCQFYGDRRSEIESCQDTF